MGNQDLRTAGFSGGVSTRGENPSRFWGVDEAERQVIQLQTEVERSLVGLIAVENTVFQHSEAAPQSLAEMCILNPSGVEHT